MVTPTMHCTQQAFRRAGLREAEFNPLPCRSALVKPTLLAQKENNKQNRAERKTRVKVSEGPASLVLVKQVCDFGRVHHGRTLLIC